MLGRCLAVVVIVCLGIIVVAGTVKIVTVMFT